MNNTPINRRSFLAGSGAAALAAAASALPAAARAQDAEPTPPALPPGTKVPTKPFGKIGRDVAVLSLGGMFDIPNNQVLLRKALDWGVTYWDTAHGYSGGKSEEGIGIYFERNPDARKQVFLVTKTPARDPAKMEADVRLSLERMKIDQIDLLYIHAVKSPDELNDSARAFGEMAKEKGWIRHFGFSTHTDMATNLLAASKLPWVEAIMTTYNYRLLKSQEFQDAVQACHDAGIGLCAMKTMAGKQKEGESAPDLELLDHFTSKGMSVEAAKLKVIWADPRITAICSQMPNLRLLAENVGTCVSPVSLTMEDREALERHASATCDEYCAGCAHLCDRAAGARVADAMRALMYERSYGNSFFRAEAFADWTAADIRAFRAADFARAEGVCPRGLKVERLMREAAGLLA